MAAAPREVVVTGLGVLSPIGRNVAASGWADLEVL